MGVLGHFALCLPSVARTESFNILRHPSIQYFQIFLLGECIVCRD